MEDWNRRFGAAIRRGLERVGAEHECCRAAFSRIGLAANAAAAIQAQDAWVLECWRFARLAAAAQCIDVNEFLLRLGAASEHELSELLNHFQEGSNSGDRFAATFFWVGSLGNK